MSKEEGRRQSWQVRARHLAMDGEPEVILFEAYEKSQAEGFLADTEKAWAGREEPDLFLEIKESSVRAK